MQSREEDLMLSLQCKSPLTKPDSLPGVLADHAHLYAVKESHSSDDDADSDDITKGKKKNQRSAWTGKLDFIMTCVGYAVGLGNIWRFPYLCYRSGGGAFFIPYCLFLFLCGMPLFFLEVAYGQFSSQSPITVWKLSPLFRGVGVGMVMISGIVCVYYNVIVAWTLYYLFASFRAVLPWSTCGNDWNSEKCLADYGHLNLTSRRYDYNATSNIYGNHTMHDITDSDDVYDNETGVRRWVSASEEYWQNHVLELSEGIDYPGHVRWQLLLCLLLAWVFVFLCLFKGVKILGKVMHFAAPFPYMVLIILLVRGVTLPGAVDGIKFYLVPRWEKLATFKVWGDAAVQIFYSVGMAWGGLITMASYNRFSNNVYRDAMIVPLINCGTSLFAGIVIFSVLGFMAHETNQSIDTVVTQGPGLTFVVYPEAVAKLPISPLWAVLFFLMLFTVGLDSQFGMFETMLSAFMDAYPKYLRSRKLLITAVMCTVSFLLGIPCITQGGIYVLQIIDWYAATFSLMILSLLECVVVSWVYGADRFYRDIELMIGYQPCWWWKFCWKYITPLAILFVWMFSVIQLEPVTYGDYKYPSWSITLGWILGMCSLVPIPLIAIIELSTNAKGSILQRIKILMKPTKDWGPLLPENRELYEQSLRMDKLDAHPGSELKELEPINEKDTYFPDPIDPLVMDGNGAVPMDGKLYVTG